MTEYLIGFRNGTEISIYVTDGGLLIKQMVSARAQCNNDSPQWYCEKLLIINMSEITFVIPQVSGE
jgi:hypothetical protein